MDADTDGVITKKEFTTAIGNGMPVKMAEAEFAKPDFDKDGKVTKDELTKYAKQYF